MLVNRPCTIPGCNQEIYAKGVCRKHYLQQWQRNNPVSVRSRYKDTCAKRAVRNTIFRILSRYEGNPYAQREILEYHRKNLTEGEYNRFKRAWVL